MSFGSFNQDGCLTDFVPDFDKLRHLGVESREIKNEEVQGALAKFCAIRHVPNTMQLHDITPQATLFTKYYIKSAATG